MKISLMDCGTTVDDSDGIEVAPMKGFYSSAAIPLNLLLELLRKALRRRGNWAVMLVISAWLLIRQSLQQVRKFQHQVEQNRRFLLIRSVVSKYAIPFHQLRHERRHARTPFNSPRLKKYPSMPSILEGTKLEIEGGMQLAESNVGGSTAER